MYVCFIGNNEEILYSLVQGISSFEPVVLANIDALINQLELHYSNEPCLILFDINHPISNFRQKVLSLKNDFPELNLWAIFDSPSSVLYQELINLNFEKIISYRANIDSLILSHF